MVTTSTYITRKTPARPFLHPGTQEIVFHNFSDYRISYTFSTSTWNGDWPFFHVALKFGTTQLRADVSTLNPQ